MTITTTYDFGDTIEVDGEQREVQAVHLYVSEAGVITERYYLGERKWHTIKVRENRRMKCR
jgi:hypothetical protein